MKTQKTWKRVPIYTTLIILILALLFCGLSATAQQVYTKQGNELILNKKPAKKTADTKTGQFVIYKGKKYDVYKGKRGGLYYWRTTKKNTKYKKYLKLKK